ncbi:MAG: site-2 protease family protein [bacterium]|nr:site-2 protease family protein [bacterium]
MLNQVIFLYIIIVISAVFHEYAHGLAAYYLGDPTAKNEGRLTLNPLVHMDLFGTVILPLFLLFTGGIFIGYAKPVPYNPNNLRDKKYGS